MIKFSNSSKRILQRNSVLNSNSQIYKNQREKKLTTKPKSSRGDKSKTKVEEDDDDDDESEDSTCESTHVKSEEDIGLTILQKVEMGKKQIFKIINPTRKVLSKSGIVSS